jgi:hypothetical protein
VATVAFATGHYLSRYVTVWLTVGIAATLSLGVALALQWRRVVALLCWSWRDVLWGIAAGGAMVIATHLAYALAIVMLPAVAGPTRELYASVRQPPGPLAGLPLLVLFVVTEEVVWRGVLFSELRRHVGPVATTLLATVAYALGQLGAASPLLGAIGLAAGLIWTAERALTGRLIASPLTHLIWNVAIFIVVPVVPRGG